jgi:hypothetical protein
MPSPNTRLELTSNESTVPAIPIHLLFTGIYQAFYLSSSSNVSSMHLLINQEINIKFSIISCLELKAGEDKDRCMAQSGGVRKAQAHSS